MIFGGEENSTGELGNFHPALTCAPSSLAAVEEVPVTTHRNKRQCK